MKNNLFIICLLTCGAVASHSCNSSKVKIPSDIMPEKKMQMVFSDALIAEGYIMENAAQQDSQKKLANIYYSEIFDKYHITKQEYYRSYDFYVQHPALFEKTLGPIMDSLSAMEARLPTRSVQPQTIGGNLKLQVPPNLHPMTFQPAKKAVEIKK